MGTVNSIDFRLERKRPEGKFASWQDSNVTVWKLIHDYTALCCVFSPSSSFPSFCSAHLSLVKLPLPQIKVSLLERGFNNSKFNDTRIKIRDESGGISPGERLRCKHK